MDRDVQLPTARSSWKIRQNVGWEARWSNLAGALPPPPPAASVNILKIILTSNLSIPCVVLQNWKTSFQTRLYINMGKSTYFIFLHNLSDFKYPSDISFRALKIKIVFFNTYAARLIQNHI